MESNATNSHNKSLTKKRSYVNTLVLASLFVALSLVLKVAFEIYFTPDLRFNFCDVPLMLSGIVLGPIWGFAAGVISDLINFAIKPGGSVIHIGFTLSSGLVCMIPGLVFWLDKKRKSSKIKYSVLNAATFVVLLVGMVCLFMKTGIARFESGQLWINDAPVSWLVIGILLVIFVAYSVFLVWFLRRKEDSSTVIGADKILFSVSAAQIVCRLILNAIFLFDLYGMSTLLTLPMRFMKTMITIPIFSLLCFVLANAIKKFKLIK